MLSRKTEDYLEVIYNIIEKKGYARVKDIALELKVSSPSVTEMMRKLNERGFIVYEKYGGITLTDKGRKIAEGVKKRHVIFEDFFLKQIQLFTKRTKSRVPVRRTGSNLKISHMQNIEEVKNERNTLSSNQDSGKLIKQNLKNKRFIYLYA